MLHDLSQVVGPFHVVIALLVLLFAVYRQRRQQNVDDKIGLEEAKVDSPQKIPMTISSTLPFVGHMLGFARDGHSYFSDLCTSTALPVFSFRMGTAKMSIIQPVFFRDLPKMRDVGLGPLVLQVFRRSLDMRASSCAILEEQDEVTRHFAPEFSRLLHDEFVPNDSLRRYVRHIDANLQRDVAQIEDGRAVMVEDWVFKLLIGALGGALWGAGNGPFGEPDFVAHLRTFLLNIKQLNNPIQCMVSPELLECRRFVRDRLEEFSFEEFVAKGADGENGHSAAHESFLGRTRSLCMEHKAAAEGWTDYQLLLIAGLGPNVMAASTWLFHHLFANEERLREVRSQVDEFVENSQGSIDLADIPEACPLLQATWYEVLRYYGDFTLGRYIREDTTLAGQYLLKKGTYALAPLKPHHYNTRVWGLDVETFAPERFLKADGSLDGIQIRKLRVFGVFGTLCPGRFLAVNMAMILVIRVLLSFDITREGADAYQVPATSKDNLAGFPTPAWDKQVRFRHRSTVHDRVEIRFKEKRLDKPINL